MSKKGVTTAVNAILEDMGFLRIALRNDLINYSALARFIKPEVDEKLEGRKASMDAIIMAVRRYGRGLGEHKQAGDLLRLLGNAHMVLRTGMAVLHLRRTSELYSKLVEFEKTSVNWHAGDKIYVNQRSEEIMVIVTRKLLSLLHAAIDRDDVLSEHVGSAIITVEYDAEVNRVPGILAFLANQLEAVNVNVYAVFNSITKTSFVVPEQDASKAYDRLNKSFELCRQVAAREV